jgi:hypothetical protein
MSFVTVSHSAQTKQARKNFFPFSSSITHGPVNRLRQDSHLTTATTAKPFSGKSVNMSQSSSDTSSYTPVQFLKTAFRIWCWPCGSPRDEEGTNESSTREESVGELRYDTLLPIFEPDPLQEPLLVRGTESEHAARWAFYTIIRNGGSIEEARRIAGYAAAGALPTVQSQT